ncbi:hypothetical protein PTKIN_Ptkin09bG0037700 [Pterospermum kingtungense]
MEKCSLEVVLNVHNPQFYWKIMTEADLGLADAFIQGDFTFQDKEHGLLIFSWQSNCSASELNKKRGWWAPELSTASIASAKYFLNHVLRQNTLSQARRNISHHYDLSNELFALFLGEKMQYSCAIFETEDEDLNVAQQKKISSLIDKARIEKWHEVLDIGCGWGSLAIEVVKRTGCKYTGISLSEVQVKFAQAKVKEADFRPTSKFFSVTIASYPRHANMTESYLCNDKMETTEVLPSRYLTIFKILLMVKSGGHLSSLLSTHQLHRKFLRRTPRSVGFLREYIFPGGCLPPLNRVLSAMAAASRLSEEHVENIGSNYFQTLRCWRKNLLENQSKILALGFDEKFIRTWEYYFDYCASGAKSRMLENYQVAFARPGNFAALGEPYLGFPSAYAY